MPLETPVGPKMESYVVNKCCLKTFFLLFNKTRNMSDKSLGHKIMINILLKYLKAIIRLLIFLFFQLSKLNPIWNNAYYAKS